jgi:hypothetical protein
MHDHALMTLLDDDLREVNQRHAEFQKETQTEYPWQNAAAYDNEKLRYILTRLAFWSGIFTAFSHRSQAHQQAGEYLFPFRVLEAVHDVEKLSAYFAQVDRARWAASPTALQPQPSAKKLSPVEDAGLYIRRVQEEIRTNRSKSISLMILQRQAVSEHNKVAVEPEPDAGICGAIHMSCGHSAIHGRCGKKMAHGAEPADCLHACNMCAQTFTG